MTHSFPPTTETSAGKQPRGNNIDRTTRRPNRVGLFLERQHPAYVEYERIHKRLVGPGTVGKLLHIHNDLVDAPLNEEYLSVAGWAAAEAALVATDRPLEDRLDLLESATDAWDAAIDLRVEMGGYEDDEICEDVKLSRLQLSRLFVPLMEGMIRGDVTKSIRQQLYADLLALAARNAIGLAEAERTGVDPGQHIGLGHELNAMLAVNRLGSPTLLAMPALARGDSGHFHPRQTHDIDVLHLDWGEIKGVTTLESKAQRKERHFRRYEAAVVGGRIHLLAKNGASPIDTVVLFVKEQKGEAMPDEVEELEGMTDTIVHLARHQLAASADVPLHCRDVKKCSAVPRHRSVSRSMGGLAIAS